MGVKNGKKVFLIIFTSRNICTNDLCGNPKNIWCGICGFWKRNEYPYDSSLKEKYGKKTKPSRFIKDILGEENTNENNTK